MGVRVPKFIEALPDLDRPSKKNFLKGLDCTVMTPVSSYALFESWFLTRVFCFEKVLTNFM